jgi:serine protease
MLSSSVNEKGCSMTQRHKISPLFTFCAAALIAAGPLVASAAGQDAARPTHDVVQTDRLIVKYRDDSDTARTGVPARALDRARQALIDRAGQQYGATLRVLRATANGAHVLQLNRTMTVDEARQLATEVKSRDANVEYAEPDRIMVPLATPTDPSYTQQWDLYEATGGINAPAAWDKSTGAGVNVAVIDTGYRPHADLSGQILQGYDFISTTSIANDGGGRDTDASDPGDWTPAAAARASRPRTRARAGMAPTCPARSRRRPTTASASRASPITPGSSRRACWAVAAATRRTSPMPWSGRRVAP